MSGMNDDDDIDKINMLNVLADSDSSKAKDLIREKYKAPNIKSNDLMDPKASSKTSLDNRATVIKRKIFQGKDVAYGKIIDKDIDIHTQLLILHLLGENSKKNIVKFHGYSGTEGYIVFEWAQHGNLKKYYQRNKAIPWSTKLQIVRDIFCGLYFMHEGGILHHDIRCKSILVSNKKVIYVSHFHLFYICIHILGHRT